ncbi:MAG: YciI family protein [Bacteroidales bacterium]
MKQSFALVLFLLTGLLAYSQNGSPQYDSLLARQLGADERGMKTYVLVILKSGPADIQDKELRDSLFAGHFSNMEKLASAKKLLAAGPFYENDRQYRGLFLYDVKTLDEARELLKGDPTVTAGIFEVELFQWYGSAALPVYLEAAEKIRKKQK